MRVECQVFLNVVVFWSPHRRGRTGLTIIIDHRLRIARWGWVGSLRGVAASRRGANRTSRGETSMVDQGRRRFGPPGSILVIAVHILDCRGLRRHGLWGVMVVVTVVHGEQADGQRIRDLGSADCLSPCKVPYRGWTSSGPTSWWPDVTIRERSRIRVGFWRRGGKPKKRTTGPASARDSKTRRQCAAGRRQNVGLTVRLRGGGAQRWPDGFSDGLGR